MNQNSNTSFFPKYMDWINLGLPLLFLLMTFGGLILGFQPTSDEKKILLFFGYFVFLNHLHIYLTPLMFVRYPEFTAWSQTTKFSSVRIAPLILSVFCLLFFVIILMSFAEEDLFKKFMFVIFILRFVFGIFHNLFQSYGMLCLYDKAERTASGVVTTKVKSYKKWFYTLWIVGGFNMLFEFLNVLNYSSSPYKAPITALSLGIVTYLVFNIYKESPRTVSLKLLHSFRLYLFALIPVSIVAFTGYLAAHGVEYFLLYLHMNPRSKQKINQVFAVYSTIALLIVCSLPLLISKNPSFLQLSPFSMTLLTAFLSVSDLAHYTMDSFTFRFSKQSSREHILPLILNGPDQTLASTE